MLNKAFVFPGQGSQSRGMLKDLAQEHAVIKDVFAQASEAVSFNVWKLIEQDPEDKLNQTEYTQVAMLTSDVAVFKLLQQQGYSDCRMMAGHSLGEYAALVCSDAVTLDDAVPLVFKRGQLMQQHVPLGEGAMAAIIGLNDEQVREICENSSTAKENVSAANYNAKGQVVIAGHVQAVERAIQNALVLNAKLAKKIPVSVPCHCSLLIEASEQFSDSLNAVNFRKPSVDVISNVDLSSYQSAQHIRQKLQEQLYSPVRWVETIELMKKNRIEMIVECGPGKILTGLTKRIEKDLTSVNVSNVQSLHQLINIMQSAA